VPLVLAAVLIVLACVALIPLSIVQRFRMGTIRRRARRWVAAVNLAGLGLSAGLFLAGAAIASAWIPAAPAYTLAGFGAGLVLGAFGILLTRWHYAAGGRLEYTPNRWLVLAVTGVVAARVLYGFWRSWYAWQGGLESMAWIAASGVAGSMAAGAVVLGYYLMFWGAVYRKAGTVSRRVLATAR
jgi:hypothetical protein